jgi:hypothetical protein
MSDQTMSAQLCSIYKASPKLLKISFFNEIIIYAILMNKHVEHSTIKY